MYYRKLLRLILQKYEIISYSANYLRTISYIAIVKIYYIVNYDRLRVQGIEKKLGLTQADMASLVGVDIKTIQNWERGRTIPKSKDGILRNIETNQHIVIDGQHVQNGDAINEDKVVGQVRDKDYRFVPLINVDSVGGMHSQNLLDSSEQYVIKMMPFTEAREGDVAILQSGSSMYPTIPSGSALLIREVTDWREYFGYGGVFVLWLKDGRRITKEIRRFDADPQNYVWCVSYNPDVADEELPKSMIRGVWKVIKYIADFGW